MILKSLTPDLHLAQQAVGNEGRLGSVMGTDFEQYKVLGGMEGQSLAMGWEVAQLQILLA